MTEHNVLTDPELHEIKGAAAATSGQIPVANGSGGAPFTAATTLFANPVHGAMYMRFNATGTSIPTTDTFVQVAGTFTAGLLNDVTFSSNSLTVGVDGIYEFVMPYSLTQSDATAQEYQVGLAVNGTHQTGGSFPITCEQNILKSGNACGLVSLSDGDVLYPMITNTTNDAKGCTVESCNLVIKLVRNT